MPDLDEMTETALKKAGGRELLDKSVAAKRRLTQEQHWHIVRQYHLQEGGEPENFDFLETSEKFHEAEYKLNAEHANLANHAIVARGMKLAIEPIGTHYMDLLEQYIKETDVEKRADIAKVIDTYRALAPRIGIDPKLLEAMKTEGYNPELVGEAYKKIDDAIVSLDRAALLGEIPEEHAYSALEGVAEKFDFNKEAVRPLGAENARSALLNIHGLKRLEDEEQAKEFKKKYANTPLYAGKGD